MSETVVLIVAGFFIAVQVAYLLWGAYLAWVRIQRERRSREIRRELIRAERVRSDALTIGSARRRRTQLPSTSRSQSA